LAGIFSSIMRSDDRDSAPPSSVTASDGEHRDDAAPAMDETEEVATPLLQSHIDSGRIAAQPTPTSQGGVAVAKVCPQCGSEYETTDRFCPKDGSPLRPKSGDDPLVGRVIADRYLVLAPLGEGGMGRVYLGEHVKMNRQCAIKVMNPSLVNDTESLQRFAREASNAARILHPNVAAVFDYGEMDKIVYLVMEFVDGEPLSAIIAREGALEPRRAIEIARQIADGLQAAHELGIVHRDLKPDNVIVARTRSGKEVPKVVDFGIAKALSESPQDALTRSGLVIGTPEYMSPEQLLGDPVDARADIYSLGCIVYQMLTGTAAFAGDTREQMIRRRLHEAPPHVRDVEPTLPGRLDTLIVHMLARSPEDRLASAAEVRDQLDPALALGGWDPRVITAPQPYRTTPADGTDESSQPTQPIPRQRIATRNIVTGAIMLVALAIAGVALYTTQQKREQAAATAPKKTVADTTHAAPPPVATPAPVESLPPAGRGILAKPDTTPKAPAVAAAYDTVPLTRIARAIRTTNMDSVDKAFPNGVPAATRATLDQIFKGYDVLKSEALTHGATQTGSKSEMPFEIRVTYAPRGTGIGTAVLLRYKAAFELRNAKWVLTSVQTK
jgi:serine/threonine-protein kinase